MSQCAAVNLRGQTDESTENLKLDKPKDAKVEACCGRSSSKLCQPPSIRGFGAALSFGTPRLRAEGASSAGASCLAGIVPFGVARSSCADHEMSQCPAVNLRGQTDESTENLKLDKPKDAKVVACRGGSSFKLCQPLSIWAPGLHSALSRLRLRAEGASNAGVTCLAGIVPFGVARSSCADRAMSQRAAVNLRGQTDESTENLSLCQNSKQTLQ